MKDIHGGTDEIKLPPAHFVGVEAASVGPVAAGLPDVIFEVVVAKSDRLSAWLDLERFHQPDFLAEHADLFQVHHAALIQDRQDPSGELFSFVLWDGPVPEVTKICAHVQSPF